MPQKKELNLRIGEKVPIRIDDAGIRDVLSTSLYRNADAGLRELYANALSACLKAKEEYGATPAIEVTLDVKNAKLEILEHDSMGMTRETFKNIYCILGRSGNFDGRRPGMFGVGMAAYRSLSDIMIIELFSRESNERMTFLGNNMMSFEEITNTNKPTLETFGTKITMTLRPPKEGLNKHYYILLIRELLNYARFSGIKTLLKFENAPAEFCNQTLLGKYDQNDGKYIIGPLKIRDYSKMKNIVSLKNNDFEIDLYGVRHGDTFTTLVGMPIKHGGLPFKGYVLKIKNERKYLPTASRDEITFDAEKRINELVNEEISKAVVNDLVTMDFNPRRLHFRKLVSLLRVIWFHNKRKTELTPKTKAELSSMYEIMMASFDAHVFFSTDQSYTISDMTLAALWAFNEVSSALYKNNVYYTNTYNGKFIDGIDLDDKPTVVILHLKAKKKQVADQLERLGISRFDENKF